MTSHQILRRPSLYGTVIAIIAALIIPTALIAAENLQQKFGKSDLTSIKTIDHNQFDRLLDGMIETDPSGLNLVNYRKLKPHRAELKSYIAHLSKINITRYNKDQQFAYWANLYNAVTLDTVLGAYPVRSINDIDISPGLFTSGPWGKKMVTVEGSKLSLDDIEHQIMRKIFKTPFVHYAINCASHGCPNLQKNAFTGQALDKQLDAAARQFVNSNQGVIIKNNRITISKIYSWFKQDFGNSNKAVLTHIKKFAKPELHKELTSQGDFDGYFYDWTLNDTKQ